MVLQIHDNLRAVSARKTVVLQQVMPCSAVGMEGMRALDVHRQKVVYDLFSAERGGHDWGRPVVAGMRFPLVLRKP